MATRFAQDRFVYVFAPDRRLTSGVGTTLEVYVDQACTTLAPITDLSGTPLVGSQVSVGADSLLPEFLDPGDRLVLWVKRPSDPPSAASEITAVVTDIAATFIGTQVPDAVADYLATSPVIVGVSEDPGNLLTLGSDQMIYLSPDAIPDPVVDHGALEGLADDDHPQYLTAERGDARYPSKADLTSGLADKVTTTDPRLTDARDPKAHTHAVADVSGLQTTLDGLVASSDPRLSDARTPTAHTHPVSEVTGLQATLDGKVDTTDPRLSDTRDPKAHGHAISEVTGLQSALDGKSNTGHGHAIGDVTGLAATLDAKAEAGHNHPEYQTQAQTDARYLRSVNGTGPDADGDVEITFPEPVLSHGDLENLNADDHPQYLTQDRGDARYPLATDVTDALAGKVDVTDPRLSDERTPTAHTHSQGEVTGLTDALAGKVDTTDPRLTDARTPVEHEHDVADVTGLQSALDGKAATLHEHSMEQVTGLTAALEEKASDDHDHLISEVVGLQSALDGKAPTQHTHAVADTPGLQSALNAKVSHSGISLLGYASDVSEIPDGAPVGSLWVVAPGAFLYGTIPAIMGTRRSSTSSSADALLTVDLPSGGQAGDVVVVFVTAQTPEVAEDWETPDGWIRRTPEIEDEGSGQNTTLRMNAVFTRVLEGPESSHVFSAKASTYASNYRRSAIAVLLRGADPATPVGGVTAIQGLNLAGADDLTIPAQNSVRPNCLQLVFASTQGSAAQSTDAPVPSVSMEPLIHGTEPVDGAVSKTSQSAWARSVAVAGSVAPIVLDFPTTSQRAAVGVLIHPRVI